MAADATVYPPVGFRFKLVYKGKDYAFQEISGISSKLEYDLVGSGGENRFKYRLPTVAKYEDLVLKRGLAPKDSALAKWCHETITADFKLWISTSDLSVSLLSEEGSPLMSWSFKNAYPVGWKIGELNSQENKIAIEHMEFAFNYFTTS